MNEDRRRREMRRRKQCSGGDWCRENNEKRRVNQSYDLKVSGDEREDIESRIGF